MQKKAERLYMAIIIITAIVHSFFIESSYVVAGFCQDFSICVYSTLGAMVVSYIVPCFLFRCACQDKLLGGRNPFHHSNLKHKKSKTKKIDCEPLIIHYPYEMY